jgi:hypothetical protein
MFPEFVNRFTGGGERHFRPDDFDYITGAEPS